MTAGPNERVQHRPAGGGMGEPIRDVLHVAIEGTGPPGGASHVPAGSHITSANNLGPGNDLWNAAKLTHRPQEAGC
jgi:hypothetical protein